MIFPKKTINDVPLDGQRVLLRADYNVPMANGSIDDDFRIIASLPTIKELLARGCSVVICSHLGRPKGEIVPSLSLEPIADRLTTLLGKKVNFVSECIGDGVRQAAKNLRPGDVLLLENLRFHAEEESNDPNFAKQLAVDTGATYFIQDGFGVVHRAHASTEAITHYLPSVAGLLLEKEVTTITEAMEHPKRPLVAILGGAKVNDKIKVIERFIDVADRIVVSGAMANTFLKYKGVAIGKSFFEEGQEAEIKRIYELAMQKLAGRLSINEFILLPVDVAVAFDNKDPKQPRKEVNLSDVTSDEFILDVGMQTISNILKVIQSAGTVIWNGTLGIAELPPFAHGSVCIAQTLANERKHLTSIIGGGDTVDFVRHWELRVRNDHKINDSTWGFTHISTGGGASIDLMAGEQLPGVAALLDA